MWSVQYLSAAAEEEAALPVDMQARLARMADTISQNGLLNLPRDWVKPLGDKLWELRITGRDGIARAIYVTAKGQRVVIVRIFMGLPVRDRAVPAPKVRHLNRPEHLAESLLVDVNAKPGDVEESQLPVGEIWLGGKHLPVVELSGLLGR